MATQTWSPLGDGQRDNGGYTIRLQAGADSTLRAAWAPRHPRRHPRGRKARMAAALAAASLVRPDAGHGAAAVMRAKQEGVPELTR